MNKTQLAQAFGISTETVDAWTRRGCPFEKEGRNGLCWKYRLPDVIVWRVEQLAKQLAEPLTKSEDINSAMKREMIAKAELREIELAEKRRDLIHRESAGKVFERAIMDCRSRLLAIPTKVAPVILSCKTVPQVKQRLQQAIDDALLELANINLAEDALSEHDEPVGAAAAADRQRVGGPKPAAQPRKQRRARPVGHVES